MTFVPRPYFAFPASLPSWFVGHMHKALRVMDQKMATADLFVEVRDARLPLSSINPVFERFSGQAKRAKRLIVYTKRDLADSRFEQPLKFAFDRYSQDTVVFADARKDVDARKVLKTILKLAHDSASQFDANPSTLNIIMAGMPNVGKSSMLNALRRVGVRKGKAAFTGANAGVTRKVQGTVKIWERPDAYIIDTPGIMVPYFGKDQAASERALSLALSGGIKDHFFSIETLGEYLLWRINHRFFSPSSDPSSVPEPLRRFIPPLPTNDLDTFLEAIGRSLGFLEKGGYVDKLRANRWLIEAFRDGRLGSWTLDDLTFSGPSYMALPHPSEGQPSSIGPSDTAVAVHEQDKFLTNAPSRPWQTTGLAPLAPHEIAVASTLSIPERVALSVSTWIDYQRHRQLRPTRAQMSSHAIKRAEKEEANENRRLKWQRKGITTRSRFLSDKPMHLRTKSGKSSIGFKRAQRKRRQSRSGPRRR